MKKFLVVPTNRPDRFARFLKEWGGKGGWGHLVVVEDAPERSQDILDAIHKAPGDRHYFPGRDYPEEVSHYSHREIAAALGADAHIISKGSSACRSFGFLKAWWEGADYVLTLDDDCYPNAAYGPAHNICDAHATFMHTQSRWASTLGDDPLGLRPRGLPRDTGAGPASVMNVGLWAGVPDLSAHDQLEWQKSNSEYSPPTRSWLVPQGQYVPVSGMNLFVARSAVPLCYFAPTGEGQPYHRFDDIWMGVVAKKVCDVLGWQVSVGQPFVRHERASDPHKNLIAEAPGLEENERFWKRIDSLDLGHYVSLDADDEGPAAMTEVGHALRHHADIWNWPYAYDYGQKILTWCRLLRFGPGPTALTRRTHERKTNAA